MGCTPKDKTQQFPLGGGHGGDYYRSRHAFIGLSCCRRRRWRRLEKEATMCSSAYLVHRHTCFVHPREDKKNYLKRYRHHHATATAVAISRSTCLTLPQHEHTQCFVFLDGVMEDKISHTAVTVDPEAIRNSLTRVRACMCVCVSGRGGGSTIVLFIVFGPGAIRTEHALCSMVMEIPRKPHRCYRCSQLLSALCGCVN